MLKNNFTSIENIINVAKKGGLFILVDDEKRENEGDLIISTSSSNAKNINFMAKYGRGLICLALDSVQAKRLNLSLMSPINQSRNKTAFTISIEAKKGITTGISAKDRAITCNKLCTENSLYNFSMPGHMFPLRAHPEGLKERQGHTEASIKMCELAGFKPAAVISEITSDDKNSMANKNEIKELAQKYKLKNISISQLQEYLNS